MEFIYNWILNNPEKSIPVVGAFLGLVLGGLWTTLTFFQKTLYDREQQQFERYHRLFEELNRGKEGKVYIDFQLNSVYELRFFRKYYPRSERMILALIPRWEANDKYRESDVEELKATLKYIRFRKSLLGMILMRIVNLVWPWVK